MKNNTLFILMVAILLIAANLGLAMDDMAVAPTIYARAVEKKIGTSLPL